MKKDSRYYEKRALAAIATGGFMFGSFFVAVEYSNILAGVCLFLSVWSTFVGFSNLFRAIGKWVDEA